MQLHTSLISARGEIVSECGLEVNAWRVAFTIYFLQLGQCLVMSPVGSRVISHTPLGAEYISSCLRLIRFHFGLEYLSGVDTQEIRVIGYVSNISLANFSNDIIIHPLPIGLPSLLKSNFKVSYVVFS